MPAVSPPPYWTASMVREIPDDGNRYECIDGELLVTPSPGNLHQSIISELHLLLGPYVRSVSAGYVQMSPLDVELDDGMIVQPDMLAFRLRPVMEKGRISGHDIILAVEVLSPGTASRDRGLKRAFYARIGVAEYWIVHPASRLVERWHAGATSAAWEGERLVWQPEGAARPLTIDLPELFDSVPEAFRKA